MKILGVLPILFFLAVPSALANHFQCDLNLTLIPGSLGVEKKSLSIDIEIQPKGNLTRGWMTTTQEFGSYQELFESPSTLIIANTTGDLVQGSLANANIPIGIYHYQIFLDFSQEMKSPETSPTVDFLATGRIASHDNYEFVHQMARGECHLYR